MIDKNNRAKSDTVKIEITSLGDLWINGKRVCNDMNIYEMVKPYKKNKLKAKIEIYR